ncbi:MAG: ABC transporter permease [Candidatus Aquicultorales bacterium]
MRGLAFFKKEVKSILKTYRIWLVPLIFVFFGILSPVTAKFAPALIKAAMQSGDMGKVSVEISFPDPTAVDAYAEWLKNLAQIGILAVILLSMGLVSEEKARGTLALVLTKPLSRSAVILSKFAAQAAFLLGAMGLGAATCAIYTLLLFGNAPAKPLLLSSAAFGVYALLILSATLFFSTVMKSQIGAGGLGLLAYFAFSLVAMFGYGLDKYSPGALGGLAAKMASGSEGISAGYGAMGVTAAVIILLLLGSIRILDEQEI